jgi:prepilin-type N-terminal cleavage/methylation domain-containing protein
MLTRKEPADAGFTLIEVLAALAVIGVVLTAVTTFFVRSTVSISLQGAKQAAIQLASSNLEQLRALSGQPALAWLMTEAAAGVSAAGTVGSVAYTESWTCAEDNGAPCTQSTVNRLANQPLFIGATITIRWTSRDCAGNQCSYSAGTRLSLTTGEPLFGAS